MPPAIPAASDLARRHWALVVVALAAATLIFTGLGRDHLWADEGDTAVLARSILQSGVPTAWDGVTFSDSDNGARLNDDLVMVSHPWVQYYAAAAAFSVLGESAFAARLPFAIAGLATVLLVYVILLNWSGSRATAVTASVLLTLSAQFLIYARQSRQYALNAALTCLLLWLFMRLRSWRGSLLFAVVGILLFHTHPGGIAPIAALGVLTLAYRPLAAERRWFWLAAPLIALFTVPWVLLAGPGYAANTNALVNASDLWHRLFQFGVECLSVTPLIGACVIGLAGAIAGWFSTVATDPERGRNGKVRRASLPLVLVTMMAAYAVIVAATQSGQDIFVIGVRVAPAIIPIAAMLAAIAVARTSGNRRVLWVSLVAGLCVTRLGELAPWTWWQAPTVTWNRNAFVTVHTPVRAIDRFFHTDTLLQAASIAQANDGTVAAVSRTLALRAGARDILVTNYEWEPLYFHTRLPQGLKILASYPIYAAARERGLPAYVFSANGARWIVWRRTWGAYRGQACDQILKALGDAQIPVELVASIPETTWENRENLHFRRFPGGRYLYGWFDNVPATLVYRVDWPPEGQLDPR